MKQILYNLRKFKGGAERFERSNYVRAVQLTVGRSKKTGKVRFLCRTNTPERRGGQMVMDKYVTMIELQDPKKQTVKVSCSCPDFWATWEVALSRKGAADIIHSNGEPPDTRNPKGVAAACIAKGTAVICEHASKKIEDIVVGDKVLTLDGYQEVSDVALTRHKATTLRVHTRKGTHIDATEDHLVLVVPINGHKAEWVRMDEIQLGDKLIQVAPFKNQTFSKLLRDYEALGVYVAEASEVNGTPIDDAERPYVEKLFSRVLDRRVALDSFKLELTLEDHAFFKSLGAKDPRYSPVRVPEAVFSSRVRAMSFLKGAWLADGWISATLKASTIASNSKRMALDYCRLLDFLGVDYTLATNLLRPDSNQGSGYTQYLVRPSVASTSFINTLLCGTPKHVSSMSNWGDFSTDGRKTTTRISPFSYARLRSVLEARIKSHRRHLLARADGTGELVPIRDVISRTGAAIAVLRRFAPQHLHKLRVNPTGKRTYAVPEDVVSLLESCVSPTRLVGHLGHGSKSRASLLSWLDMQLLVPINVKDYYRKFLQPNVIYKEVISVTPGPTVDVYDMTVPNAGHFTANGFVFSNCKHIIKTCDLLVKKGYMNNDFEVIEK